MGRLAVVFALSFLLFVAATCAAVGIVAWLFGLAWHPWVLTAAVAFGWVWMCLYNLIGLVGMFAGPARPGVTIQEVPNPTADFRVTVPPAPAPGVNP